MANFKQKPEEDMSMEDILSSIRKYVSEEDMSKANKFSPSSDQNFPNLDQLTDSDKIINLDASNVLSDISNENTVSSHESKSRGQDLNKLSTNIEWDNTIQNTSNSQSEEDREYKASGPFNKLAEALKTYGKQKKPSISEVNSNMTVDQFFRTVIESYIQKWAAENLKKLVEQIVLQEIERLKSE